MAKIFHLLPKHDLDMAKKNGKYEPATLKKDQYIHCSKADQILEVANNLYRGRNDLMLIRIVEVQVTSEIKHEPPREAPMSGITYPHIYGILNMEAMDKEFLMPCEKDGSFKLPMHLLAD